MKHIIYILLLSLSLTAGAVELDGNIINDGSTDWIDLFDVSGDNEPVQAASLPGGYAQSVFVRDFNPGKSGPDISTFATGSKDTLDINPGWECSKSNNVNDKTDILNAYATAKTDGDDVIVYFALERYSNEGDGNIGFWFLKDGSVACDPNPKSGSFTGNHSDGDILIVSEFSKGGDKVDIIAYKWLNGALISAGIGSQCPLDSSNVNICATVNSIPVLEADIPWLTETKKSGQGYSPDLDVSQFFEGKINLTQLGLVGCFSKYMAVTRSSTSLTATLFDYALGNFELCSIDVTKQCSTGINPVVNSTGDAVITLFDVNVLNDGVSTLSDVSIKEDITFDDNEYCEIVAYDGIPLLIPVDISDGNFYKVADSLTRDQTLVVQLKCESNDNPLVNKVTAAASSIASSNGPDLTASYEMTTAESCPLDISPMIDVTKSCNDLRLVHDSGVLTVEVEADITVSNTSDEKLTSVTVADYIGDSNNGTVIPVVHVDVNGVELEAFDGILAPSETVYFKSTYIPTDTDDGIDTNDSPGTSAFTDRAEASGTGVISNSTVGDFSTATCPLCQ